MIPRQMFIDKEVKSFFKKVNFTNRKEIGKIIFIVLQKKENEERTKIQGKQNKTIKETTGTKQTDKKKAKHKKHIIFKCPWNDYKK